MGRFGINMQASPTAVFKVEGSIAALVKEDVWEKLLKGETVGVIEPDPSRWSLFINGAFVKTIVANTEVRLNIKSERAVRAWEAIPGNVLNEIEILPGYPNMIRLTADKIKAYTDRKLDARTCSTKVRELVKKSCGRLDSLMGVFAFMDEVDRGMERQGRD